MLEANVILAKCNKHNRAFGILVEKENGDWVRKWAYEITEAKAKREGFDKTSIAGSLYASPEYPGCPHCGERSFVCCSCGKLSCWKYEDTSGGKCNWCGKMFKNVTFSETFDVPVGGD